MIDTIRMNINEYELNTPISFLEEVSCKIGERAEGIEL